MNKQNAITSAVRELRIRLGDTQQEFASRTKMAISTVVRYELSRPPKGKALLELKNLAENHGFNDIARVFSYALGQSVTTETAALNSVITTLWWNRDSLIGWPQFASHLVNQLVSLIAIKRKHPTKMPESIDELEAQLVQLRSVLFGVALKEINIAASKIFKKSSGLTREQAYTEALAQNPELYNKYLTERSKAARDTGFEESLAAPSDDKHRPK